MIYVQQRDSISAYILLLLFLSIPFPQNVYMLHCIDLDILIRYVTA